MPKGDPALGQVIGADSHCDLVAKDDADAVSPQPTCQVGLDLAQLGLDFKIAALEHFDHGTFYLNQIVTRHAIPPQVARTNETPMFTQALSCGFPLIFLCWGCSGTPEIVPEPVQDETVADTPPDSDKPEESLPDDTATPDTGDPDTGSPVTWPRAPTILDRLTVVDSSGPRPDQALVLVSDEIWAVMDAEQDWPPDAMVVDLHGRYAIPGLIDAHVHLFHSGSTTWVGETLSANIRAQLAWGVLGVADLGSPVEIFTLRDQVALGSRIGPRIWATGPFLTATGSHPCETRYDEHLCLFADQERTPSDVVAVLNDADGLKVALADADFTSWPTPRLDLGDLAEIVTAAAGKPVWAHIDEPADLSDAAAAGVAVMTHPIFSESVSVYPDVVTTSALGAAANVGHLLSGELLDEDLSQTPAEVVAAWSWLSDSPGSFIPGFVEESADWAADTEANVATAISSGQTLLAGSDAGYWFIPHGVSLHRELEGLVAAGMTPLEALTAATATNAEALGWSDMGHLDAGYRADFVILTADPLADIRATRAIESVWQGGTQLDLGVERSPAAATDAFCLSDRDCAGVQVCDLVDHRCRRSCADPYIIMDSCGPDAFCMPTDALSTTTDGVCHPGDACDLYTQDCAPSYYGANCSPHDVDTNRCIVSGPRQAGQSCSYLDPTLACQQGLFCSWIDARCYEMCDPSTTTPGCDCRMQMASPGVPWFGLCL